MRDDTEDDRHVHHKDERHSDTKPSRMTVNRLTFLVYALVIVFLLGQLAFTVQTFHQLVDFQQQQIVYIQKQNDLQLCAQHDIIVATRKIGQKLGLPVRDIMVPSVEGLNCVT